MNFEELDIFKMAMSNDELFVIDDDLPSLLRACVYA